MPSWKKVIVSGSDATLNSLLVSNGITGAIKGVLQGDPGSSITGSLQGTASFANFATIATNASMATTAGSATTAATASYVNTLNQNVIITGSAAIGTSSLGASENTLTLGARDSAGEGGQLGFNAPGGTYTSASFIDNWQNKARILKGNNTTSTGLIAQWDIHTTQMQLAGYTGASSFPGTATANLAVDSGGNVITVSTTGGTVFPYTGNAVITGSLTTTGIIYAQPNGGMYFQGGDDAALYDINLSNHMGIYGVQDSTIASIKLGSGGGIISGKSGNIGIGTTNPTSASLQINGNVWATSFTGSLLGNASTATSATSATTAATASSVITAGSVSGGSHYFLIYTTSPNGGDAGGVRTSNLIYNSSTNTLPTTSSWATNATNATSATNAASAALVSSAVTFNNGGSGDASGTSFNGANARTISYNTIGAYAATNPSGYTTNTGTVTSVSASGTVSGLTLGSGGSITTSGTITLSGTISGLTNGQLVNSAITIAGTSTSLGGSISQATILASSGVFSGSAQIPNSSIANAQLANSSITVGSTAISLGSSATTIAGLSSVTSTNFIGTVTTASLAMQSMIYPATGSNHRVAVLHPTNTSTELYYDHNTFLYNSTTRTLTVGNGGIGRVLTTEVTASLLGTASYAANADLLDGQHGSYYYAASNPSGYTTNTGTVTGTGTTSYIPKFTSTSAIGNSAIYDDGGRIGIGTNSPSSYLAGTTGLSIYNASTPALGLSNGTNNWLNYLAGSAYRIYNETSGTVLTVLLNGDVGIGTASPNSKLHVVGNTSMTGSTNITGSLLVRNGLGTVLDTTNYNLVDGAVTSVAWGDRTLKDTNNFATVDWEAMRLGSPQGGAGTTVDWGAGVLKSPAHAPSSMSIDWDNRVAYDIFEGGSIDWNSRVLSNGNTTTVDWSNLSLLSAGIESLNWGNFELYSQDTSMAANWNDRYLADSASMQSVSWNERRLSNPAGSTLLTWAGNSATLTGTSSWATNVVNNGVTSVGGTGTVNGISLSGTVTSTGNLTLGGTLANIQSSQLATSSLMIGSTNISLGATGSTLAGLTSVTSTNFVGTASVASTVNTVRTQIDGTYYPTFVDSVNGGGGVPEQLYTVANANLLKFNPFAGVLSAALFEGPLTGTASWATNVVNNGVTSVGGTGTVNGISLSGTVTSTGNLTLGGTLSGIGNAQLTNSSVTIGSTAISLGATSTTLAGLTSVTSTNFVGTASVATLAASASAVLAGDFAAGTYSIPWMSQKTSGIATYFEGDTQLQYVTSTGQLNATTFNGSVTSTDVRVNGTARVTGSLDIQQSTNTSGSGVRLRQQGTSNVWEMYVTASTGALTNGLQFRYNGGNNGGYLDAGANAANIDFTGQHRSLSNTINITGSVDLTGLIVVADGTYTNLNNNHLPQINEALPNVSLSTTINDKRVFGVISDKEEKGRRDYAIGSWVSTYDTSGSTDPRLIINSLGEGGMWICNANGSLENGDYITTSNLPGYGMKQADDILHNYTVAKITEDCLFDSMRTIDFDFSGSAYKKQFVGVTYHCG